MRNLQKMGALAALYQAAAYVAGIVFFLFIVDYSGVVDPAQKVALLVENRASIYLMTLLIYVVFGATLVVLALALQERLKAGAPAMARVAAAIGLIWAGLLMASGMVHNVGLGAVVDLYGTDPAQAATVWLAVDSVVNGLGGQYEIAGGLWTVLVSWAALRGGGLPRALNYLGLIVGVAGLLTVIPPLSEAAVAVFALGQIGWFTWLGIILWRSKPQVVA